MGLFEKMMGHAQDFSIAAGTSDAAIERAGRLSPRETELCAELAKDIEHGAGPRRLALLFSGDVQGVGFRWTNQSFAQDRHLTGWVKNLPNGTVQMEIQGPPQALAAHLERIHAYYARFGNRIWLEQSQVANPLPNQKDFEVKF